MSTMTPTKSRLLAVGLALVILGTGVVVGVTLDRLWLRDITSQESRHKNRHRSPERQLEKFRERLDLDVEQTERISVILHRVQSEVRTHRDSIRPAIRTVKKRGQDEILSLLTPDQAIVYVEMIDNQNRRQKRRHKRDGKQGRH